MTEYREKAPGVQRRGVDRQCLKGIGQYRQQPEMAVKGEKQQRNQQVEDTGDNRAVAGARVKKVAKERPICMPIISPARRTAAKINCKVSPIATPITTCFATTQSPVQE